MPPVLTTVPELRPVASETWRELIKRLWEVDPLLCPQCGRAGRSGWREPGAFARGAVGGGHHADALRGLARGDRAGPGFASDGLDELEQRLGQGGEPLFPCLEPVGPSTLALLKNNWLRFTAQRRRLATAALPADTWRSDCRADGI